MLWASARSAARVDGQAPAAPTRTRSAAYTPIGKPTSMPTTGITKKPMTANSPPTTSVLVGTEALSRRPGRRT